MNGKPIVLCNPCLCVREASIENMKIVGFSHATEQSTGDAWCEGLLRMLSVVDSCVVNSVALSKEECFSNIHSSVFTVPFVLYSYL